MGLRIKSGANLAAVQKVMITQMSESQYKSPHVSEY